MSFERQLNKLIFGDFEDLIGEKGLAYLEKLDLAGRLLLMSNTMSSRRFQYDQGRQ